METCSVTFESVDEILWCDHSNETSLAVLLHGTICFSVFLQNEIRNFSEFLFFVTPKGIIHSGSESSKEFCFVFR